MSATNSELRARLLRRHPALNELAPADREYFLEVEEDLEEARTTGVTPARLAARIAEARSLRENSLPYDEDEEAEWSAAIDEARAEVEAERSVQRQPKELQPKRARHKAVS